jgi:hypothetical protein
MSRVKTVIGGSTAAGKPDNNATKSGEDLLTNISFGSLRNAAVSDEKNQDCRFWARGQCVKGNKCPQKHDPAKDRPHKGKDFLLPRGSRKCRRLTTPGARTGIPSSPRPTEPTKSDLQPDSWVSHYRRSDHGALHPEKARHQFVQQYLPKSRASSGFAQPQRISWWVLQGWHSRQHSSARTC